jgi:hypothetical protein
MAVADSVGLPSAGWLRGRKFDLALIMGVTGLALTAATVITVAPETVFLIWLLDAWFLGYPHVAATFVRLAPDRAGLHRHRFLIFVLPVIVLATTIGLASVGGIALIATIYFFWQWFHTMRQSWGIAQIYRRRSTIPVLEPKWFAQGLFFIVALWGLLHRMSAGLDYFLFENLPLYDIRVPAWLSDGVGAFALAGLVWWAICRTREWMVGELPLAHTLFSASHYLIFIVGYVVMDHIAGGWLVTNIWHTAQYLMVVWLFNQNVVEKAGWYFRWTHSNSPALFFTFCLLAVMPVYFTLNTMGVWWPALVPLVVIASQTINFHHFIVDAVIWRKRRWPAGVPA